MREVNPARHHITSPSTFREASHHHHHHLMVFPDVVDTQRSLRPLPVTKKRVAYSYRNCRRRCGANPPPLPPLPPAPPSRHSAVLYCTHGTSSIAWTSFPALHMDVSSLACEHRTRFHRSWGCARAETFPTGQVRPTSMYCTVGFVRNGWMAGCLDGMDEHLMLEHLCSAAPSTKHQITTALGWLGWTGAAGLRGCPRDSKNLRQATYTNVEAKSRLLFSL
ncbi:hypothetical protein BZA05DRAFT_126271 [Tricharina praecox]|uniref:uncharacterized protein n=1 Tax=Tricharina praecox TaxID=43433 RepID=UPI00221EE217|nr:uncharacterized protein BZA05DRAFT_126271 [Tricharina praecox]KAI5847575.1 hypothetical protein BZA05DRAFT_126271 [Tricharina praecox]